MALVAVPYRAGTSRTLRPPADRGLDDPRSLPVSVRPCRPILPQRASSRGWCHRPWLVNEAPAMFPAFRTAACIMAYPCSCNYCTTNHKPPGGERDLWRTVVERENRGRFSESHDRASLVSPAMVSFQLLVFLAPVAAFGNRILRSRATGTRAPPADITARRLAAWQLPAPSSAPASSFFERALHQGGKKPLLKFGVITGSPLSVVTRATACEGHSIVATSQSAFMSSKTALHSRRNSPEM